MDHCIIKLLLLSPLSIRASFMFRIKYFTGTSLLYVVWHGHKYLFILESPSVSALRSH
jgi:hypothetical protein